MGYISIDLDETLICSLPARHSIGLGKLPDIRTSVYKNGESRATCVFLRPDVHEMLAKLSHYGELNIFTHGTKSYADPILQELDLRKYFSRIFTREDTLTNLDNISDSELTSWGFTRQSAVWIKDLRLVNSDLNKVVAIDNDPSFYSPPHRPRVLQVPNFDRNNPIFPAGQENFWDSLFKNARNLLSKIE